MLPSADTVGLNSGRSEFILPPRFSILRMVSASMILFFLAISFPTLSMDDCAGVLQYKNEERVKSEITFFNVLDLDSNNEK